MAKKTDAEDRLTSSEIAFANNVQALRKAEDLTQSDLAGRMRSVGLSYANQTTVSRIESKDRAVRLAEAEALAHIFRRTIGAMTAPDGREALIATLAERQRSARDELASLRNTVLAFQATQQSLGMELDRVLSEFDGAGPLAPDVEALLNQFVEESTALMKIYLVDEVTQALHGEYPEAP